MHSSLRKTDQSVCSFIYLRIYLCMQIYTFAVISTVDVTMVKTAASFSSFLEMDVFKTSFGCTLLCMYLGTTFSTICSSNIRIFV